MCGFRVRCASIVASHTAVSLQTSSGPALPIVPKAPPEREKAREQRERAIEFAKKVPRPKAQSARALVSDSRHDVGVRPQSSDERLQDPMMYGGGDGAVSGARLHMSAVDELEAKHLHMRAQVDAIRREFGV